MFPGEDNKPSRKGISYTTAGGIVLTELLLSATWLPYAVFYIELIKCEAASLKGGLWIPVVIVSGRSLSNPLTRKISEHFSDNDFNNHRLVTTVVTLTMALAIILGACTKSILLQTLTYGLFCGMSSSFISNQLKEVTYEEFQAKPLFFEGLQQVGKAISLFFMPHVFYYLAMNYSVYEAEFLFAALLLHLIPITMVINRKQCSVKSSLSRYKTLPTLYNQKVAVVPTLPSISHNQPHFEENNSDSSSDDEDEIYVTNLEPPKVIEVEVNTVMPPYCKNFMGVDILPEIPEEDEIEEEQEENMGKESRQKETMRDSIRRFSQLSAKFEDLISNEVKSNGYHSVAQSMETYALKFKKQSTITRWSGCNCCSPYQKYLHKKRWNRITDCFFESLMKPLCKGLRILLFYPCLITKVVTTITSVIYVVFVPYLATTSEEASHADSAESTMLLSLMAFPWLCFLVFLPWLINSSKNKMKAIFSLGIFTLGISTFLINLRVNYDMVAIATLLFGFSYGSLELSCDIIYKEVAGIRQWKSVRSPLEILSGLLVVIIYGVICALDVDLLAVLGSNLVACVLLTSVWLFIFFKDVIGVNFNVGL